jgi:hypothetical protein
MSWSVGSFAARRGTDADTAVREAFDDAASGYAPLLCSARRSGEWMLSPAHVLAAQPAPRAEADMYEPWMSQAEGIR